MSKKNRREKAAVREAAMENAIHSEIAIEPIEEMVDFDAWWAGRATKIPPQHHKEIIKADFRGRGLSMKETMESFDDALKEYGIKL